MVDLRLSPSGPVIAAIGAGFITKQWRASILATGGGIDLEGLGEVGLGLGSPPVAAAFSVPVLPDMNYSTRLSAMFTSIASSTNSLQVALQYSNDNGVGWNDIARNTMNVPGIINLSDGQQAGLFRVTLEPDALLGSAMLPPAAVSGDILFRGTVLWGGASSLLWTSGTGTGSTELRVQEELAS